MSSISKNLGHKKTVPAPPCDLGQFQILPISDWEKFERFCRDLWADLWKNPELERHGRQGQPQAGVDVYGESRPDRKFGGIQCKRKDAYADSSLTEKELRKIVNAAKKFKPRLDKFVVAYTGKRDVKLQRVARDITQKHKASGWFTVSVASWNHIVDLLGSHREVADKYFGFLNPPNVNKAAVDDLKQIVLDRMEDMTKAISEMPQTIVPIQDASPGVLKTLQTDASVTAEFNAELDLAKKLIDEFRPKSALEFLEDLGKRIRADADKIVRYRLLTNKAAAKGLIGDKRGAGELLIAAHQYNPDDEKALCNRALGHALLGQNEDAREWIDQVLKRNPASRRAYGILVHCAPSEESLDQIIQKIPEWMRQTEEITSALGYAAASRGKPEESARWLELALEAANKDIPQPDLWADLAGSLLQAISHKLEVISRIQVTAADGEKIQRIITLLNQAIEAVRETETIKFRSSWFVNRGSAHRLLGEFDLALSDIESALSLDRSDARFLKHKAIILYERGDVDSAVSIFRRIICDPATPEISIILAGILHEKGQDEEAVKILEESPFKIIPDALREGKQHLLIEIYLALGDYDKARATLAAMRASYPGNILNLVEAARVEKATGDEVAANRLLDEAFTYVSEKTPFSHRVELANELYVREQYTKTWPLLEKVVDAKLETPLTNQLLYSYYRAGEVAKGLAACRSIPEAKKSRFVTQIHIAILEEIRDLSEAVRVEEAYLSRNPNDIKIRIRWAATLYRLGEREKLDAFLKSPVDLKSLPLDAGLQLVALYLEQEMPEKALDLGYELRRKYYEDPEAHLKYVGLFFTCEKKLDREKLSPREVGENTAVQVDDNGSKEWYVIENRQNAEVARNELDLNNPLAQRLLGKHIDDEVVTRKHALAETKVKIGGLKSKYVHALHETFEIFPHVFPDTPGLERVPVTIGEEKKDIERMLEVIGKRDDRISGIEKLYLNTQIPLGTFANLLDQNPVEVLSGLSNTSEVRNCSGTAEERESALDLIRNSRTVVVDVTAIYTCAQLQKLDLLKKVFDQLLVGQSTIDLLRDAISEHKGATESGFMRIWKDKDGFRRREVTAEEVRKNIQFLETMKNWVIANCRLALCPSLPKLRVERPELSEETIGESFLEAFVISRENKVPLYSDDLVTRLIASKEFGVSGFWTQVVALHALNEKLISQEEYSGLVIRLIQLRFRHTTINEAVLLDAARKSGWATGHPFLDVADTLTKPEMELRSIVKVAAEFFYLLWQQPIFGMRRDSLVVATLDSLTCGRRKDVVLKALEAAIRHRFRFAPLIENDLLRMMVAWYSLKV